MQTVLAAESSYSSQCLDWITFPKRILWVSDYHSTDLDSVAFTVLQRALKASYVGCSVEEVVKDHVAIISSERHRYKLASTSSDNVVSEASIDWLWQKQAFAFVAHTPRESVRHAAHTGGNDELVRICWLPWSEPVVEEAGERRAKSA